MEIQMRQGSETQDDIAHERDGLPRARIPERKARRYSDEHAGDTCVVCQARRGNRWISPSGEANDVPLQGFAVTVRSEPCLAIEDAVGCALQVLAGQAWITAEGAPRDTFAGAGTTVPLELGVRFNVSAFRDFATVLITTPRLSHDVGFSLQQRDGVRVLTVTAGRSRLPTSLAGTPAAIAAFARRSFAAARATTS
jgi:hypothetical protein